MTKQISESSQYIDTMSVLEKVKRVTSDGTDFWMARDIHAKLGYPAFDKFEPVINRAREAFVNNGVDPSHHIAETSKLMGTGKGAQRQGVDYFLSRGACYLIAMNGDPSKPEVAAAQAYFATQTRAMEKIQSSSDDEKRLELREKVGKSFKVVSGVAKDAGVANHRQALFHDARYQGLYGMSLKDVKTLKGLGDKDVLFDHAGSLELSAHDFQMQAAADAIKKEAIRGESRVIAKNKEVAVKVRNVMIESGATVPEKLPIHEPIKDVKKRIEKQKKLLRQQ
ncbi:MAG: hypothetical protein OEL53_12005 [Rhodospirillales bacterium]|nr:hypothetical protein [Rhodospirillales bacterium]